VTIATRAQRLPRGFAGVFVVLLLVACAAQPQPDGAIPDWRDDPAEPYPFTTPIPAMEATAVDGVYTREPTDHYPGSRAPCVRCPPYPLDRDASTLILDHGRFEVFHVEPRFRAFGHYTVEGDRLLLFNDAECTHQRGEYRWSLQDGRLQLAVVNDPCAYGRRAGDLTDQPWRAIGETGLDCQPPDEEAAVTGHWPVPSGC
jgi:hypothetical protein